MHTEKHGCCPELLLKRCGILLRERIALYLAFLLFCTIGYQSYLGASAAGRCCRPVEHCSPTRTLFLEVRGEVQVPGWYTVESGTSLAELLEQVGLTRQSDTSKLNLNESLRKPRKVVVPRSKLS